MSWWSHEATLVVVAALSSATTGWISWLKYRRRLPENGTKERLDALRQAIRQEQHWRKEFVEEQQEFREAVRHWQGRVSERLGIAD